MNRSQLAFLLFNLLILISLFVTLVLARTGIINKTREVLADSPVTPPSPECVADVNGNGRVEIGDISGVLFYWGGSCSGIQAACVSDININGYVEIGDIAAVLFYWNSTCFI